MKVRKSDSPVIPSLAYKDEKFLDSDEARPLRILAEYLEPLRILCREQVHETIVFFGSARITPDGPLGRYYQDARELAKQITTWSKSLRSNCHRYVVCSGGGPGIMEAANRGASEAGGRTIGLNIGLPHEQQPNPYITRGLAFEFHYFFMRKLWFAHLARALVVFPGGFGTLDEMMEILTLEQTQKLDRPITVAALRIAILEGNHQLRRAGAARHDQPRRSRPVQLCRRSGNGAEPAAKGAPRASRGRSAGLCPFMLAPTPARLNLRESAGVRGRRPPKPGALI